MSAAIQHRYDFVYLFDITDGNPNGDPDAGNLPRIDPETSQGLVTDVCLKRKIRNYVSLNPPNNSDGLEYKIYVRERAVLNTLHEEAYEAIKADPKAKRTPLEKAKAQEEAQKWMCRHFFDIRTFGAVMTTGEADCGQVRGPLQLTFARSIDPIVTAEFAITRCAVTNEKDAEKERTMGRKFTVPYGLYRCHGFLSSTLAEKTGFSEDDFALLKDSLNNMFDVDHSAARGLMAPVRCIAFRHENKLGNARADELFSLVTVEKRPELQSESRPPRSRNDYVISLRQSLPEGVTVEEWVTAPSLIATS